MRRSILVAAVLVVGLAAPSFAADPVAPAAASTASGAKGKNPNEVICEYQEQLGSRLSGHKVCATRYEWAQRRQDDRMGIERGQLLQSSAKGN